MDTMLVSGAVELCNRLKMTGDSLCVAAKLRTSLSLPTRVC